MAPTTENKLKLTENGAAALRSWMARNSVSLVELADAVPGAHPMAVSRWCKRQGLLTLEQLGHLVAYAAGELTAEMLVGRERAAGVPTYKPRVPEQKAAAVPAAPADADGEQLPDGIDRNKAVLAQLRDDPAVAPGVKADCAMKLARLAILEAQAERERERQNGVREVDLIEKFETLLYNARRQATELAGGGAEATPPTAGAGVPGGPRD